jgi:hypothetical protein
MSKEEVLAGLRASAQKLGRTPKYTEVHEMTRITRFWIKKYFSSISHAFREAGIEPIGPGHPVQTSVLLEDWAHVARKLGHVPSISEYRKGGRFSIRPFFERCRAWNRVPEGFRTWIWEQQRATEWEDVLALIGNKEKLVQQQAQDRAFRMPDSATLVKPDGPPKRRIRFDRPIYGPPLSLPGMRYEPVNEQGVVYIFGKLAEKLGIEVERIQTEFPDCEAMREIEPGRWQRVRIEFEYASRNFHLHRHAVDGCDIIVCWIHNWPDCPENLEVIELRSLVRQMA